MDELLDRCYDRLDATAFIAHLEGGLKVRRRRCCCCCCADLVRSFSQGMGWMLETWRAA